MSPWTSRSVPILIAVLALAGCSGERTPGSVAPSEADTTPGPTRTAAPTHTAVAPSQTAAVATLVPTPEPLEPTALDPHLVLRVDIRSDVDDHRVPMISVYRDGTVLRWSDAGGEIVRLTPDGLAQILAVADGSGLLATSGDIGPDPGHAAGFMTYSISFDRAGSIVRRSVVNAFPESRRAEAERFIALAERLSTPDAWLPAGAWLTGPAVAAPWVPDRYLLKVVDWGSYPDRPGIDMASVVWPLDVGILEIGDPYETGLGAAAARCGVVTLAEAQSVVAALAAVLEGQRIPAEYLAASLAWAERDSQVAIALHAVLPDEPSDCAVDQGWP